MTTITDSKIVYSEFKSLKPFSVPLNFSETIFMDGRESKNGNNIKLYFSKNSDFYIIFGEITLQTEFGKWLAGKVIKISQADFSSIGKTLKKNAGSIEYDDNHFSFKTFNEDGSVIEYRIENNIVNQLSAKNLQKIMETLSEPIRLEKKFLSEEVLEVYLNEKNKICLENTGNEILLEVPIAKLDALLKDVKIKEKKEEKVIESINTISFSDIIDDIFRYVCFSSYNPELGLKLSQVFLTV